MLNPKSREDVMLSYLDRELGPQHRQLKIDKDIAMNLTFKKESQVKPAPLRVRDMGNQRFQIRWHFISNNHVLWVRRSILKSITGKYYC